MPRGPKGEKRPADVIGNAVHVMRIATGEVEDTRSKAPKRAKGGKARAKALSPAARAEIARTAATARWKKRGSETLPSVSASRLDHDADDEVRRFSSEPPR